MSEQSEVTEVTETANQDRNLHRTVEQTLLDFVEAVEVVPQKRMSERTRELIGVIEVPETSSEDRSLQRTVERALGDFVEVDKTIPQERISMYERSEVVEVPAIPSQESVEVDKNYPSGANFRTDV